MSFELQFGEELFAVYAPLPSWTSKDNHGHCAKCHQDMAFILEARRFWIPDQVRCGCHDSNRPLTFVRKLENPYRRKESQIEAASALSISRKFLAWSLHRPLTRPCLNHGVESDVDRWKTHSSAPSWSVRKHSADWYLSSMVSSFGSAQRVTKSVPIDKQLATVVSRFPTECRSVQTAFEPTTALGALVTVSAAADSNE